MRVATWGAIGKASGASRRRPSAPRGHEGGACKLGRYYCEKVGSTTKHTVFIGMLNHLSTVISVPVRIAAMRAKHYVLLGMLLSFGTTDAGLLKKIDPILTPDLLYVLRAMGHGDKLCICDCNFPAAEVSCRTTSGRHIILAGVDLPRAMDAVLELMPLDYFVDSPAGHMAPQTGGEMPPAGEEVISEVRKSTSPTRTKPFDHKSNYNHLCHAASCHATPRHATPRHATPRHRHMLS